MVRENWMYTILLPPSIQFFVWESTNFPKIQVYQVSHVDVHHVLEGLVTSSPFDKNAWQWTWKTGPTRNISMWSMLLILLPIKNAETSHTSPTSPKTREETTFGSGFRNELFLGTPTQSCLGLSDKNSNYIYFMPAILLRSPCQLRLWSCAGVQELLQPTLAAAIIAIMPKKTKLQTPHIPIDA